MGKASRLVLAALGYLLSAAGIASAQVPNWPQTLQPGTIVGRLNIGPGPAQAIPFSALSAYFGLPSSPNNTVLGNISGVSAQPTSLTAAQLTTLCNVFTSSLSGCVAASGGGTSNFLRADGSWVTPSGGGNVSTTDTGSTVGDVVEESGTVGTGVHDSGIALAGISGNVLNSQTSNYTVASTDCGKTVQAGTGTSGFFTVTLPAVTGFAGTCVVTIVDGDAGRGKALSGFPSNAPALLFPGQTIVVAIVNGAWATLKLPYRWRLTPSATTNVYVDQTSGSDSNDCLAATTGACKTLQNARNLAQQYFDLVGSATVQYNVAADTFTGVSMNANGPLVGQAGPANEIWSFASGAVVEAASNGTTFQGVYGAQFEIVSASANLTFEASGSSGVCISAGIDTLITVPAMTLLGCGSASLQTTWGGELIVGGDLAIEGNAAQFIFASGGVVQLDPGLTHDILSTPVYSVAFAVAYAGGVIGINGQTFTGTTPTGPRYLAQLNGIIATGTSGASTYLPGSEAGSTSQGGQYY